MGYSGFTERLCVNGHYTAWDVHVDDIERCQCGEPFRYSHGVDLTNGYSKRHSSTCHAPKEEIGFDDEWHSDHHGNLYATKARCWRPLGRKIWVRVNSRGQATPPYEDDLAPIAGE